MLTSRVRSALVPDRLKQRFYSWVTTASTLNYRRLQPTGTFQELCFPRIQKQSRVWTRELMGSEFSQKPLKKVNTIRSDLASGINRRLCCQERFRPDNWFLSGSAVHPPSLSADFQMICCLLRAVRLIARHQRSFVHTWRKKNPSARKVCIQHRVWRMCTMDIAYYSNVLSGVYTSLTSSGVSLNSHRPSFFSTPFSFFFFFSLPSFLTTTDQKCHLFNIL